MPPYAQQTGCDLHLPHPNLSPDDPSFSLKFQQNNLALQRWAAHFYRNCAGSQYPPIFSWPGPATVTDPVTLSPPWWPKSAYTIRSWRMKANVAGDAILTFYLNGSIVGTLELEADDDVSTSSFSISMTPDDKLNVAWTEVGIPDTGSPPESLTIIGSP